MNDRQTVPAAMEGQGFYNRHSEAQAAGIAQALPLFEAAARSVPLDGNSVVIADYGSSQGRNSIVPMRVAIDVVRERVGFDTPIEVIHTDLASNDFASLFTTLQDAPDSYMTGETRVYPSAIGRSFYEPIIAPKRVHLGWSSWALHWLSRNPVNVDDHIVAVLGAGSAARDAVKKQQQDDWKRFLSARSSEMRDGAKLLTLFMGATPDRHGWEWILGELWQAITEMGRDGILSPQEQLHMTLPLAGRTVADLEAPFESGPFEGLSLEHAAVDLAPDPFWDLYKVTHDAEQLGRSWAGTMRAVSPTIAAAVGSRPDSGEVLDELYARFAARISAAPQRHEHYAATAVIRKG